MEIGDDFVDLNLFPICHNFKGLKNVERKLFFHTVGHDDVIDESTVRFL